MRKVATLITNNLRAFYAALPLKARLAKSRFRNGRRNEIIDLIYFGIFLPDSFIMINMIRGAMTTAGLQCLLDGNRKKPTPTPVTVKEVSRPRER